MEKPGLTSFDYGVLLGMAVLVLAILGVSVLVGVGLATLAKAL